MTDHTDRIVEMHESGESRDTIIVTLVGDGLTLNAATKAYGAVAKALGWATARVSHKEAAMEYLHGWLVQPSDWDAVAVKHVVIDLCDRFGVAESTARDYCRAFSEEIGVPYPVEDPRKAMFDWLVEHAATATKEEFVAFAGPDGLGRSASNVNEYWKGLELHRAILAAE
jgi:hypothetical protein